MKEQIRRDNTVQLFAYNSQLLISPSQGGRVLRWTHNNGAGVTSDVPSLPYNQTYGGAVLFPFANRIKDGRYRFRESEFQLPINDSKNHSALHGLIYNKHFIVDQKTARLDKATLQLDCKYRADDARLPFHFDLELIYKLLSTGMSLRLNVKNVGNMAFPFTAGWHPYFKSSDLKRSALMFKSNHKIEVIDQLITSEIRSYKEKMPFPTDHKELDHCYKLINDPVLFTTPEYQLEMTSTSPIKYLQFYKPPVENVIAIEPTTGISDRFNNGEGLQILKPQEKYSVTWSLNIISTTTN